MPTDTLRKARELKKEDVCKLEQKEYLTVEELRTLLYRTVDDIYNEQ